MQNESEGIGNYTTFYILNTVSYKAIQLPLLLEQGEIRTPTLDTMVLLGFLRSSQPMG
jgi:hypothetical protein